jgi:membrane peptidoglycan carboxypeptidase
VRQGAATITMQYVRMAPRDGAQTAAEVKAATEQTTGQKIREARLALAVEEQLSKQEMMERYLNYAYAVAPADGEPVAYFKPPPDSILR